MKTTNLLGLSTALLLALGGTAHAQSDKQLTNLPTIYIQTQNGQDITSKEYYVTATLTYIDGDETTTYEDVSIRGRGNSTWYNSEKKPYRIKFAKKQKFLGKGFANAKNWTLLANHGDKSMIHNALTYDLGRFLGMEFCPAARFVDLYLNGRYRGTYQISDHVQVKKKRVPIAEETGWFLELANENAYEWPYFNTLRKNYYVNIKNPKDEFYTESIGQEVRSWVNQLENVLFSNQFKDPEKGYRAYVDETTLINWYVGMEITGNADGLHSIYGYKEADEPTLRVGPLWDLDLAWGETSGYPKFTYHLVADAGWRPFEASVNRLWEDPWFAYKVSQRMNQLIRDGIRPYLQEHVDSLTNVISQSQAKNYQIWPINQKGIPWEGDDLRNTYGEYTTILKNYIDAHIPYLQREFAARAEQGGYVDGIEAVTDDEEAANRSKAVYNLNGTKVGDDLRSLRTLPPGIYIYQGKKVVVK